MPDLPPHTWLTLADLAAEMRVSEDEAWREVRRVNPYTLRAYRTRERFRVRRKDWEAAVDATVEPIRERRTRRPRPIVPSSEDAGERVRVY